MQRRFFRESGSGMNPTFVGPDRQLVLPDGRVLAYRCFGEPSGRGTFFFHGFPGSGLQGALLDDAARDAGVCLVAPDRPGFGHSSPHARRSIAGFSSDVAVLADHLGFDRFDLLGVSCGGPYALACAASLAPRVGRVALLAGIGPMDRPELRRGQLPMLRLLFGLARLHPVLCSPFLAIDRLMFRRNAERAVDALASMLTPPDQRLLASRKDVRTCFAHSLAEAYLQGIAGARQEAALIARAHGIRLESLTVPVEIHQGGSDRHVPPAMARHLATQIPGARLHFYPDEGHLSVTLAAAASGRLFRA